MSIRQLRFTRIIITLLIITNLATITILVVHFRQDRNERLENKLDLTEEQRANFKEIRNKYRDLSMPTIDTMRKYQAQLITLTIENAPDSLIEATKDSIVELQRVSLGHIMNRYKDTRSILNDEQKAILDSCYYERFQCPMRLFRTHDRNHRLMHDHGKRK